MVSRSHGGENRQHRHRTAVRFGHVDAEGTAVGHGGTLSQSQHDGGVFRPRWKDVFQRCVNHDDGPGRGQTCIVDRDVVVLNGRAVVLDGQRDVQRLSWFKNGMLNINRQQDRVVSGSRHDEGRQTHGHQSEDTEHRAARSAGHGSTKPTLFKRFREPKNPLHHAWHTTATVG